MKKTKIDLFFTSQVSPKTSLNIISDLKIVFGEKIEINTVCAGQENSDLHLNGDICLVMRPSARKIVRDYISDDEKVVVVSRTISENTIHLLYDIPDNTTVLVVNDSDESTQETVSMLYKLGVTHLKMVAYTHDAHKNYDNEIYKDIEIAVTPGESIHVPNFINKIVDIGERRLDMQTFLDILSVSNLGSDRVNQALIDYSNEILELHTGIKKRYVKSYLLNKTFNQVFNVQKTGIIVTDASFMICYWNAAAESVFLNKIEEHSNLSNYFGDFGKSIFSKEFCEELLSIENRKYMVSRTTFKAMDHISGYCFSFESAEDIRKRENDLSVKLKKQGLFARYTFEDIIYRSKSMETSIRQAKKVALSDYSVLITGETGTGKELFAQAIHNFSHRRNYPFVAVNCAALPESLLESELFGYEDGAFTGAKRGGKPGLFEQAQGGTVFLDEIGDMPYNLQSKLLRVLQENQIVRVGGSQVININVRIITATNCNFEKLIQENKFRTDLYYRLNVFPLKLVPLRERKEDIIPLFCRMLNIKESELKEEISQKLLSWTWPGNVREVKNTAQYYNLMGNLDCLSLTDKKSEKLTDALPVNEDKSDNREIGFKMSKIKYEILDIIFKRQSDELTTGRATLIYELRLCGETVSESRLEKILLSMQNEGLVLRNRGRSGIHLTCKGQEFLRKNK